MSEPYSLSAELYDRIYGTKDYAAEAETVRAIVERTRPGAKRLLEVACGTGSHLAHLARWYEVEGLDASAEMIAVARGKLATVPLHVADMRTFSLGRTFDAVTCLFSSIGYVRGPDELDASIATMASHLVDGGVLIVEPWFTPDGWRPGAPRGSMIVDDADLKVARMVVSSTRDRFAVTPMHHLVARPSGVTHFVETHELFLATTDEYRGAFTRAGLAVELQPELLARGAWVGRKLSA
jgi:SAM-dependent methyltransferase